MTVRDILRYQVCVPSLMHLSPPTSLRLFVKDGSNILVLRSTVEEDGDGNDDEATKIELKFTKALALMSLKSQWAKSIADEKV